MYAVNVCRYRSTTPPVRPLRSALAPSWRSSADHVPVGEDDEWSFPGLQIHDGALQYFIPPFADPFYRLIHPYVRLNANALKLSSVGVAHTLAGERHGDISGQNGHRHISIRPSCRTADK